MTKLAILTLPNNILTNPCDEVDMGNLGKYQILIDDMFDTMNLEGGLGLAANQVGITKKIIVYGNKVIINPRIIAKSGSIKSFNESCLSVPEESYNIKRYRQIVVKGYDREGKKIRIKPRSKIENIVLQHEIDHVNGITIRDRK